MEVSNNEEYDEEESEEECVCKCYKEECVCHCECVDCDQDWLPGVDDDDTESDYDSDDSMDYIYDNCGLDRKEKKQLQDQLRYLEVRAEMETIEEEEQEVALHPK